MKNVLLPTLLVLFTSCSPATSNNEQNQPQSKLCQRVKANTIQEIAVKGMVCQMGCGGSIRKALKETCAVERVEVRRSQAPRHLRSDVDYERFHVHQRLSDRSGYILRLLRDVVGSDGEEGGDHMNKGIWYKSTRNNMRLQLPKPFTDEACVNFQ
jgi:hypothetical protein